MIIEIDFNSDEAIYLQLRNQIVFDIAREHIKDGDSLPSVRQLAVDLGVNMHTVNKAYTILKQEGYLQLDRRHGAIISVNYEDVSQHYENINESMKMIVAESICKGVSLEDLQKILTQTYEDFQNIKELFDHN